MSFHENLYICQVNNLVLACAFSNVVAIYDASTGTEIHVSQRTSKNPQYLEFGNRKLLIGTGNILYYHQYISQVSNKRNKNIGKRYKNNDEDSIKSQLELYDEREQIRKQNMLLNERLRRKFVGDLEYEELELQIALIESKSAASPIKTSQ